MEKRLQYMKIAICEKDEKEIIRIENFLEEIGKTEGIYICMDTMRTGEKLLEKVKKEEYDLIFLAMKMEDMDSIALGKKVHEIEKEVVLFFMAKDEKRIKEVFECHPSVFIDKPVKREELEHWFRKMVERFWDTRRYLTFSFDRNSYHIPWYRICYLESNRHYVSVNTEEKTYRFYGRLDDIEKMLPGVKQTFIRIHKSYMVNWNCICWMDGNTVKIDSGETLPVSAAYREKAKKEYQETINKMMR